MFRVITILAITVVTAIAAAQTVDELQRENAELRRKLARHTVEMDHDSFAELRQSIAAARQIDGVAGPAWTFAVSEETLKRTMLAASDAYKQHIIFPQADNAGIDKEKP